MKRAKILIKSFRVASHPLSPSIADLHIFDSKRAKTHFAHWTTFFILVASNLHSAEGLKRLRDVRQVNELTQKRDLNLVTSHSAATSFMVLRLWVVRRAKRIPSTRPLSPLEEDHKTKLRSFNLWIVPTCVLFSTTICTKQQRSVCKGVVLRHLGTCPSRKERMTMRHQRPDLCLQKISGRQSGFTGAPGSSGSSYYMMSFAKRGCQPLPGLWHF